MADVADLSNAQLKEQNTRLERELRAAVVTVEKLLKSIREKDDRIKHLESLVKSAVPVVVPKQDKLVQNVMAPEEEISDVQLHRLREISRERQLTLEETKMYDLLVKNKRLSQEGTQPKSQKPTFRDVKDADLLEIVGRPIDAEEKDSK